MILLLNSKPLGVSLHRRVVLGLSQHTRAMGIHLDGVLLDFSPLFLTDSEVRQMDNRDVAFQQII